MATVSEDFTFRVFDELRDLKAGIVRVDERLKVIEKATEERRSSHGRLDGRVTRLEGGWKKAIAGLIGSGFLGTGTAHFLERAFMHDVTADIRQDTREAHKDGER